MVNLISLNILCTSLVYAPPSISYSTSFKSKPPQTNKKGHEKIYFLKGEFFIQCPKKFKMQNIVYKIPLLKITIELLILMYYRYRRTGGEGDCVGAASSYITYWKMEKRRIDGDHLRAPAGYRQSCWKCENNEGRR